MKNSKYFVSPVSRTYFEILIIVENIVESNFSKYIWYFKRHVFGTCSYVHIILIFECVKHCFNKKINSVAWQVTLGFRIKNKPYTDDT